jgi:hypothetical protein
MRNELSFQSHRTAPEPQNHIIDKSQNCRLASEVLARPQEIPSSKSQAALERLVRIARGDSGQCRIVANFLLAWWNAMEYGGFDLTDVWAVDSAIAEDMIAVFTHLFHCRSYPDSLGYGQQFQIIAQRWR